MNVLTHQISSLFKGEKWALLCMLLLSSCASKVPFSSAKEIKAKTINSQTKNSYFIPKEAFKPLHVRVNMIFLLDQNGEGNFNGKNEEDNKILKNIFKQTNRIYANLINPNDEACYKENHFIKDTKIRFDFIKIYVKDTLARNYRNAKGFNENKRSYHIFSPSRKWYLKDLDNNINDTIAKKGINAYYNMDVKAYDDVTKNNSDTEYNKLLSVSVSEFPSYSNLKRSSQICFPNKYTKRLYMENIYSKNRADVTWNKQVKYWYMGHFKGIAHELGHSLSLGHSNEHSGYNKCANALMYQGKSKNNYIQPTEIGKMHKALMTTNLIQFVDENENYNVPKIVSENENWDFKTIRFYQDIIVEEGTILVLNGNVILPKNAHILLEKNAFLVLNKAQLTTPNNKPFTNIIKSKHARVITY